MRTNLTHFPAIHFTISSISPYLNLSPFVTMSTVPETITPALDDDDLKIGFQRPEMNTEKLTGTAISYDRHVILCYKTHDAWPSRVESSHFPKLLAGALKARKNYIPVKTLLTICEGRQGTGLSDGDVLLFPEMVKYRGLKEPDINSFVEEVIVNRKHWSAGAQETMTGSHIFVCAHSNRDQRCGFCGPILISKFKEEIELRGLENVSVTACSHVGGHKYAGNLIIYSVRDKKVCGDWYGYVTPSDVPELLDSHIGKGEIIDRIWRGKMGVTPIKKFQNAIEQTIQNNNDLKFNEQDNQDGVTPIKKLQIAIEQTIRNHNDLKFNEQDNQDSSIKEEKENIGGGCCQGANGFSCCRDESSETEKEVNKENGKRNFLMRKWEKHEVFTVTAVVGAVLTVSVAYNYYKRLR